MSEPLRIGILDAARIAELSIVTPAAATGHRLVAVAARDDGRARSFADTHGVERIHETYDALLADTEVEAVYNPLANGLHGPWNLRAIRAGKHVLSEKPFAANAGEAREVAAPRRPPAWPSWRPSTTPFTRSSGGSSPCSRREPSGTLSTSRPFCGCRHLRRAIRGGTSSLPGARRWTSAATACT